MNTNDTATTTVSGTRCLLDFTEAQRDYRISRTKAYQLLAEGKLRAVKLGARTFLEEPSVKAFVASLPAARIGASASA